MTVLIYLLSKHFTRIVDGHVSMSFSNMLNLKNILIMLILAIISMSSNSDEFKKTGLIGTEYKAALYCMNIVSSVILVTIYIILTFYPTDGFVSSIAMT